MSDGTLICPNGHSNTISQMERVGEAYRCPDRGAVLGSTEGGGDE